jgi:hypothetical protein
VRDIPAKWLAGGAPIISFCRHHGLALSGVGTTKAIMVPGSSSGQDSKVAFAAVPGRELWVLWFDVKSGHIQLVEPNATATGFGPVQTLAAPPHLSTFEGLEADASAGSLDIVALATASTPAPRQHFFDTQVMPAVRSRQVAGSPWWVAQPGSLRIRPRMDRPDGPALWRFR